MLFFPPPFSEYESSQGPDKKRTVYQMALSKKSLSPLLSYCKRVFLNLKGIGSLKSSFSCFCLYFMRSLSTFLYWHAPVLSLFKINWMKSWLLPSTLLHQTTRVRGVTEARGTGARVLFPTSPMRYCWKLEGNGSSFGCFRLIIYKILTNTEPLWISLPALSYQIHIYNRGSRLLEDVAHLVMEVTNACKKIFLSIKQFGR